jgi:hypothetical protein
LHSIFLLELTLLSHRGRQEIDSELTQRETQELDRFLTRCSDELTHIAAWIADEEEAPAYISDDSIRLLQKTFEEHRSRNSQAIAEICQKMVSSLAMLRMRC